MRIKGQYKSSEYMIFRLVIYYLLAYITMQAQKHKPQDHSKNHIRQNQEKPKQYKYLRPSVKLQGGFFKSYQFDLVFPEIKDSMISKNLLEGALQFLTFKFNNQETRKKKPTTEQDFQFIEKELPIVKVNFSQTIKQHIKYTWIGHSTAVIQIGSDNFIIDPVFSHKKASKRYRPPACSIKQLPKIDVVLISHDHYDHFDSKSLQELQHYFKPVYIAGIGSDDILPKHSKAELMDWMQSVTLKLKEGQYKVTFVPASHWARRGVADLNMRLWGGFVLQTPFKQRIFYSGDTGYCQVFKQIGQMFGPFDLSILPIGAYQPRDLLKPQHINPQEAVKIHKDIRSKQSVGVHWGTFSMGREGFAQPKYELLNSCKKYGIQQGEFIVLKHGQSKEFYKK